jgi:poly-gamma-glutamate biosynthesis protein PgsC/CapC
MTAYLYADDVVRVLLVVGILVSVMFYERFQLTTGGIIVPAYLTLALGSPISIALTLLCGITTWWIVTKGIMRRWILYGRRRFEIEILVGLALVGLVTIIRMSISGVSEIDVLVTTIGFLVPGILAHDIGRQGPLVTIGAVAATTAMLALFMVSYVALLSRLGANIDPASTLGTVTGYNPRLILVAVFASVLIGMLVFSKLGIRPGGFVTGAYVALLIPRWADLGYVVVVAGLAWFVAAKLLMPRLPIFGRRKLATMVLVAALFSWTIKLAVEWLTDGQWIPGNGLVLMTLMAPALLANDAQRQGVERTSWGLAITTSGVYGLTHRVGARALALGGLPTVVV